MFVGRPLRFESQNVQQQQTSVSASSVHQPLAKVLTMTLAHQCFVQNCSMAIWGADIKVAVNVKYEYLIFLISNKCISSVKKKKKRGGIGHNTEKGTSLKLSQCYEFKLG